MDKLVGEEVKVVHKDVALKGEVKVGDRRVFCGGERV